MPESGLPQTINRYQVIRLLGRGAMGNVYLARDPALEREVALKVIAADAPMGSEIREACLSRFAAEAKTLARLQHPSIVQVYDTGEHDGEPWIAFQLVNGESLEILLERRKKLSVRRAALFAVDIASALRHAHGMNIVHRDIKPANILIEQSTGIAKLSDFGVARASWAPPDEDGAVVGSAGYMAPEQIDGQIADARSDLFSLGVVLYQMITGSHPFLRGTMAATMSATCRGDYRPLCEIVPDAPKSLDTVLRRCLFVNPTMRMKSAAELIDALRPLTREESAPPPACSVAGAPRRAKTALSIARRLPGVVADVARLARAKDWRVAAARSVKSAWETVTGGNESSGGEAIEKYASFVNAGIRSGAGNSKKSVGSGFRKGAASPASGLAPRPTGNALVKNRSR